MSVLSTVISSHFSTKLPMQIPRASLLATVALAATATAQLPVHQTLLATSATSWWAKNAVDLDDQNGDGVRDFAVATVHYNSSAPDYVEIYSGATGQLIRTLAELSANDNFGDDMAGVGDVNGDGIEDLLVGSRLNDTFGAGSGAAHLYSGADGSILWSVLGTAAFHGMGGALTGLGDIDGDNVVDWAVAAIGETIQTNRGGIVHVYSGATGNELYWFGNGNLTGDPSEGYADILANAGDLNGDGTPDILVSAPGRLNGSLGRVGAVEARSGVDGTLLFELYEQNGMLSNGGYGRSIAGGVDVNGDGVPEILIGSPGYNSNGADGSVNLIDGATHATLAQHLGTTSGPGALGYHTTFFGDMNGDGFEDYGAAYDYTGTIGYSGYVRIYSGADHSLLEQLDAPNGAGAFGSCLCALGDVTGDRMPDVFVGARYEREGYIMCVAGSRRYGEVPTELTQTLDLDWLPGNGPDPAQGAFHMTGAAPNAPCYFVISGAPFVGSVLGSSMFVSPVHPGFAILPVPVDQNGVFLSGPTTLRQPPLAGISFFCQMLALDLSSPTLIVTSAALEVRLTK